MNFWWLQDCLSILPKLGALRKSKFSWWRSNKSCIYLLSLRWAGNQTIDKMVAFLEGCIILKGCCGLSKKLHFLKHLWQLKGYLGFTGLIKIKPIEVTLGVLYTLVLIFEYINDWPLAGFLSANFKMSKKFRNFLDPLKFEILNHKLA